jgi:hypothetical protein
MPSKMCLVWQTCTDGATGFLLECVLQFVPPVDGQRPRPDPAPVVLPPARRQRDPARKQASLQDLLHLQPVIHQSLEHPRRRPVPRPLPPAAHVVAMHQQDRQPLGRGLPALRVGDRLPLVVGAAVPDPAVQQVDLEQVVATVAVLLAGSDLVADAAVNRSQSKGIGRMVVAADDRRLGPGEGDLEQLADVPAEGPGRGRGRRPGAGRGSTG